MTTQVEMIEKLSDEINRELLKSTARDATGTSRILGRKAAGRILEYLVRMVMADLLMGNRAIFPGLGIFSVADRAPRECINPQTGKKIGIKPGYKIVKFKASKEIRENVKAAA